jgi:hypothetical protein
MPVRRSRPPTRLTSLALATAVGAAGFLGTACSGEPEETRTEDVYCATEDGQIIDEKYCDDDDRNGGGGFIFIGSYGSGWGPGYRLPPNQTTTGRIPYNDSGARERAGLPGKGKLTGPGGLGGKVTRTGRFGSSGGGKTGGFSKGGGFGGGGAKGGSGS